MEPKLSIDKGEYIFQIGELNLKLIVHYQKGEFELIWQSKSDDEIGKAGEMEDYATKFAQKMIAGKSKRNFYKPIEQF